jgi:VWFA-related protein
MGSRWISWTAKFVVAAALAAPAFGQNSNGSPQPVQMPALPSTTRPIVLDIVVTDKSGSKVSNLSRNDFTILEDNNPQMIADFERPDQHKYVIATKEDKRDKRRGEIASPALTILVIDGINTKFVDTAFIREMVRKYLQTHGPKLPQPTALMVVTDTQLELVHDYTEDAGELEQALQRYADELPSSQSSSVASSQAPGQTIPGDMDRLLDTVSSLKKIAAANRNYAGRKNVIWISQGFPALNLSPTSSVSSPNGTMGPNSDLQRRVAEALSTTADEIWDARLAVYTIDSRGLQVPGRAMDVQSGGTMFQSIAPQTGGRMFFSRSDLDVAIADSVDDGADYYTLSYYPKNHDWNGKFRSIRVEISRPGLQGRTRSGYYATPDAPDADANIDSELTEAVTNPLPYRALNMSVSYKVLSGTPRMVRYTIAADRQDIGWQGTPEGDRRCTLMAVAMSVPPKDGVVKNDVIHNEIKSLEGTVKTGKFDKQMDEPMLFTFSAALPPDAGRVRVVVRDEGTGNIGTADLNFGEPANIRGR